MIQTLEARIVVEFKDKNLLFIKIDQTWSSFLERVFGNPGEFFIVKGLTVINARNIWGERGVGFLQSRRFLHPTPKTSHRMR
ncbi:hypothetical protein L1887_18605 [Cichorium endivia]|nr:hypothetical protein L1887_18605 [Cichorium endivia]